MTGSKQRYFAPLSNISLEELVPHDNFYWHLERTLDLSFVREFVQETYAGKGRPSSSPAEYANSASKPTPHDGQDRTLVILLLCLLGSGNYR
jgi:hypothetical protein